MDNEVIKESTEGRVKVSLLLRDDGIYAVRVDHSGWGWREEEPYANQAEADAAYGGLLYGLKLGHRIAADLASDLIAEYTD